MYEKHYIQDYTAHVANLKSHFGEEEGLRLAVGGQWEWIGQLEACLLKLAGLRDGMRLIDLGCGSGRLATVLAKQTEIRYHGIDIISDLLTYARSISPRNYIFTQVEKIEIPDYNENADVICAFSLFTHLLHEETFAYLQEVHRVLKPGGVLVFSFIEFAMPSHWTVFESTLSQSKNGTRAHLNVFIERPAIEVWAKHLGFKIERYIDGHMGDVLPLPEPMVSPDGTTKTHGGLGQSTCILRKEEAGS